MSILDAVTGLATGAVQQSQLTVRTNLNASAPISMTPFAHQDPKPPNPIMLILQPELVLNLPTGPVKFAPYGTPSQDDWDTLLAGLGLAALAFMGLGALVKIPWFVTAIAGAGSIGIGAKMWMGRGQ